MSSVLRRSPFVLRSGAGMLSLHFRSLSITSEKVFFTLISMKHHVVNSCTTSRKELSRATNLDESRHLHVQRQKVREGARGRERKDETEKRQKKNERARARAKESTRAREIERERKNCMHLFR